MKTLAHRPTGRSFPVLELASIAVLALHIPAQIEPSGPVVPYRPGEPSTSFVELEARAVAPDHDLTNAVALGDVDGDGDLDIVFGNHRWPSVTPTHGVIFYAGENRLHLNDGTGSFIASPVPLGRGTCLALGDVDGDGDLDLVSGTFGENFLFINDGSGSFTDRSSLLPSGWFKTYAIGLADMDGDGDLDLVTGDSGTLNRLYVNDGTGTFTDETSSRMPNDIASDTHAVAIGDLDRDGDPDLVLGFYAYQDQVFVNDGTGSFVNETMLRMPIDTDTTRALRLGDVDGDGDLDLIAAIGRDESANLGVRNRLYLNDGQGRFLDASDTHMPDDAEISGAVAMGDVDGDGDPDLVFGDFAEDHVYLNDGSGHFASGGPSRIPDTAETWGIALGDLDGDGDLDVVSANVPGWNGRMEVGGENCRYLNDGAGNFTTSTASPLPSDADGTFAIAVVDVDGDGDMDMIFGNRPTWEDPTWETRDRLFLNGGSSRFTEASTAQLPPGSGTTTSLAAGDVDGDGDPDLVCGRYGERDVLYLNDGAGTFTESGATRMPDLADKTLSVTLGDVDGDGDLDMVSGTEEGQNRLYRNDGTGTFQDASVDLPGDADWTNAVTLADVDGDGDLDLLLGNTPSWNGTTWVGQDRLYLNSGSGSFTDETAGRMPFDLSQTTSLATGDVDGDGDLDLVLGDAQEADRLYLNDGAGVFSNATATRMPPAMARTLAVALSDMDGDGDLDLVAAVQNDQNHLYLNDGTGSFYNGTWRLPPDTNYTNAVALGDLDGDRDPDIVFGNGERNVVLTNLHVQAHTPFPPALARDLAIEFYARPGYGTSGYTAIPALNMSLAPAPIALPPLGSLYLEPSGLIALPMVDIDVTTGRGTLLIKVPSRPALVGKTVHVQALIVNQDDPDDAWLTNYTADVIRE